MCRGTQASQNYSLNVWAQCHLKFVSKNIPAAGHPLIFNRFFVVFFVRFCAVTEGSSEYSDSDLDMSRRRSRRSQKKQVNYCETSESEGSQAETNRAKTKPRRQQESSDSDGQSETLEWLINLFRLVINQMS